jgi:hypothetical protein
MFAGVMVESSMSVEKVAVGCVFLGTPVVWVGV